MVNGNLQFVLSVSTAVSAMRPKPEGFDPIFTAAQFVKVMIGKERLGLRLSSQRIFAVLSAGLRKSLSVLRSACPATSLS
jgi:hypothetical protein